MMQTSNLDATVWDNIIASMPGSHILQTWEWGQVKSQFGWQSIHLLWNDQPTTGLQLSNVNQSPLETIQKSQVTAAALVLHRSINIPVFSNYLQVLYVPKGPLLNWGNPLLRLRVLDDLRSLAQKLGAIFIKIDPDIRIGTGIPGEPDAQDDNSGLAVISDLKQYGWRFSREQVQFRNTVLLDLSRSIDSLLAGMKQKTRYNIRLAERRGVRIRLGTQADIGLLYRMYSETSKRDGFVIRDESYYRTVWGTFIPLDTSSPINLEVVNNIVDNKLKIFPSAIPLIAEVNNEPVAALIYFLFANKVWFLYGMSLEVHREKMPNYLLQWEVICRAKKAGCYVYDLWGAPDEFKEKDPLMSVFRFKQGLGGQVIRHIGAWDLPVRPILYNLYTRLLPKILDFMRRSGQARMD